MNGGRLHWQLWAKRDHWSKADPKWMQGSVLVDPRDIIFGPKRYSYADHGDPVTVTVRMPHGDDHPITVRLRRQTYGRTRGRKRLGWTVDVDSPGIPTKPGGRGQIMGLGVPVSAGSVRAGTWPLEAAAAVAERLTGYRTREGWAPETAQEATA